MSGGRKKAPCVDIQTDARKDERFEVLGALAGYNRHEALGRMFDVWAWCVDRGLKDAPPDSDGYVVSDAVVLQFLGPRGVVALLADGCDDFALGARVADGRIYLRGTSDYVAARRRLASSSSAGGQARAAGQRGERGRFASSQSPAAHQHPATDSPAERWSNVSNTTIDQPTHQPTSSQRTSREPAANQPDVQPATSNDHRSSSSPSSSGSEISLPRASARDPRAGHPERGAVARAIWDYAATKHSRLKAEGVDPTAIPWLAMPSSEDAGWKMLLERCDEMLAASTPSDAIAVGRRRIDNTAVEARDSKSLFHFVATLVFERVSFATWSARSPEQVQAELARREARGYPRAGPRSSGAPGSASARNDHPDTGIEEFRKGLP